MIILWEKEVLNLNLQIFIVQNEDCKDYGKINNGNIVGNGTYKTKNGKVYKFHCKTCEKSFTSNSNTILHDLRTNEEAMFLALKMIP
ncbi:MAG: IS1 family transposase partial [Methanobrevibacter sp. CfCl-M3]